MLFFLYGCFFIVTFVLQRYGLFFIESKLNPLIITNIINNFFNFVLFFIGSSYNVTKRQQKGNIHEVPAWLSG